MINMSSTSFLSPTKGRQLAVIPMVPVDELSYKVLAMVSAIILLHVLVP